jgi:hypothetical protein
MSDWVQNSRSQLVHEACDGLSVHLSFSTLASLPNGGLRISYSVVVNPVTVVY